jgi:hypothetical protein
MRNLLVPLQELFRVRRRGTLEGPGEGLCSTLKRVLFVGRTLVVVRG